MIYSPDEIREAANKLLPYLRKVQTAREGEYAIIQQAKDDVLAQYQPIFSLEHIPELTEEEYRSFLMFRNNKHWRSLQRMGLLIQRIWIYYAKHYIFCWMKTNHWLNG